MTVFMTKTWGFTHPAGPLQFSAQGDRDRAKNEKLQAGDLVVYVGTLDFPTPEDERGRLLAVVEPTNIPVSTYDYPIDHNEWDYDEDGNYRWPFGLTIRRAWALEDRPFLKEEISDRSFGRDSARTIVPLTDEEAERVLRLRRREVDLALPLSVAKLAALEGERNAMRKTAPPPTTRRAGSMHMRRHAAFTYAMAIEGANVPAFKIGWAFDYRARARQFNHAALPALGGLRYREHLFRLWDTAREAYAMEQALFRRLDTARHRANSEVLAGINEDQLLGYWMEAIDDVRKRTFGTYPVLTDPVPDPRR